MSEKDKTTECRCQIKKTTKSGQEYEDVRECPIPVHNPAHWMEVREGILAEHNTPAGEGEE